MSNICVGLCSYAQDCYNEEEEEEEEVHEIHVTSTFNRETKVSREEIKFGSSESLGRCQCQSATRWSTRRCPRRRSIRQSQAHADRACTSAVSGFTHRRPAVGQHNFLFVSPRFVFVWTTRPTVLMPQIACRLLLLLTYKLEQSKGVRSFLPRDAL